MKIVIGQKYKVVGGYGGCFGKKCKDCPPFSDEGIIVTRINTTSSGNLSVTGKSITIKGDCCDFDPRDLKPFIITNWQEIVK